MSISENATFPWPRQAKTLEENMKQISSIGQGMKAQSKGEQKAPNKEGPQNVVIGEQNMNRPMYKDKSSKAAVS